MKTVQNARLHSPLLAGMLYSAIFLIAGTLVLSLMLAFTGMKEQSLSAYSYVIHGAAVFAGGLAAGRRADKKGWYHGAGLGLAYTVLVALIAYFGFHSPISYNYALMLATGLVCGAFGGAIGVNLSNR